MSWLRGSLAVLTIVMTVAVTGACTGGDPVVRPGEGLPETPQGATPVGPTADPTVEALLASVVDAVRALEVEYPNLSYQDPVRYDSFDPQDPRKHLYDQHGFVEGTRVIALNSTPRDLQLRIDVFGSRDGADGFRADFEDEFRATYEEEFHDHELVEVPGWPGTANFRTFDGQFVSYTFVHGPAAVWLRLWTVEFESPAAAGVELGTALDLVQASLDETVPIPG